MNRSIVLTLIGLLTIAPVMAAATAIGPAMAQVSPSAEIDRAINEGLRLLEEGNQESLRKATGRFERALELAKSSNVQDKQAFSLMALGRINNSLGKDQKALEFYNQALPLWRAIGNSCCNTDNRDDWKD